jgi:hypothetical protein
MVTTNPAALSPDAPVRDGQLRAPRRRERLLVEAAFALHADGDDTVVRLRHSGISTPAIAAHYLGWMKSGLPKLKRVAEGEPSRPPEV